MAKIPWSKKIAGLKKLLKSVGPLWPSPSTELSGYGEEGPYHCGNCEYLRGLKKGKAFIDPDGKGRCEMMVVIQDPDVKKDEQNYPIVDPEKGCCEFVEPLKKKALIQIEVK